MKRFATLLLSAALTFAAGTALAQVAISELPEANALTGAEEVPIVQGLSTARTTAADIAALAGGGGGATSNTWTSTCWLGSGTSACAVQQGFYIRVGNIVDWSFQVNITNSSSVYVSNVDLPIASAFAAITDATGVCVSTNNNINAARISANITDDRLQIDGRATTTAQSLAYSCTGSYRVL